MSAFGQEIDQEQSEMLADAMSDEFQKKFFAARRVWPHRDERCTIDPSERWAAWFEKRYGESLASYRERARREGHAEFIRAWHAQQSEERAVKCPCSLCAV